MLALQQCRSKFEITSLWPKDLMILNPSASRAVRPTPFHVAAKAKLATMGIDGRIEPGAVLHCRAVVI